MKPKEQVVFDIQTEKFKYLQRGNHKIKKVVDIDVLIKRLNEVKKSNIYNNVKIIGLSLATVFFIILVSVNF